MVLHWLDLDYAIWNQWCDGTDNDLDTMVNYVDYANVVGNLYMELTK